VSALSESCSKSARTVPVISNAVFVRSSSTSKALVLARSRSHSTCSAERRGRVLGSSAWRPAASRALRH
jgi:hypothetical protein